MRRVTRAAALAVVALLPAACTTPAPLPPPADTISVRGCTPEGDLLPGNTLDACGLQILEQATARPVGYEPSTGAVRMDLATSIESTDQQTFTVHLDPGRRYSDGTLVKAQDFVDTWSWNAYGPHQQAGRDLYSFIDGADEMACPDEGPCLASGLPTRLRGLTVLDDQTFTIRTTTPLPDLINRLGHPAFAPYPESFFTAGAAAYAERPVTAGAFVVTGHTPEQIVLEANEAYAGPDRPKLRRVEVRMYDRPDGGLSVTKAYEDVVAGTLDFTDTVPTDLLLDGRWASELEQRHKLFDTAVLTTLTLSGRDPQLADPRLRRALSLATDRSRLTAQVFQDIATPATGWVSPMVTGYPDDACAELCRLDRNQAQRLYRDAGGYQGQFTLSVNADGGHKQWADALCHQWSSTLGLDCQVKLYDNQAALVTEARAGRLTGAYRLGWVSEQSSADSYLSPFVTGSPANLSGWSNPDYDAAIARARTLSGAEATAAYRQAEELLVADPPSIPLWTAKTAAGWSTRLTGVQVNRAGQLDLRTVGTR